MNQHRHFILSALLLAAGIAAAGYFIGQTLYNSRTGVNTAEVKGLAERRVKADRAVWQIRYEVAGTDESDMAALYAQSERQKQAIVDLLGAAGFADAEVTPGTVNYQRYEYRDSQQRLVEARRIIVS